MKSETQGKPVAACLDCHFSSRIEGSDVLLCRRYAPPADPDPMRLAKFPRVTAADWCGEFVRAEEKG